MIVAATLPLVAEYGTAVTTGQVARAAGIGEGTIFRAFADKARLSGGMVAFARKSVVPGQCGGRRGFSWSEELLDACLAEAMNPDHALRELASVSLDEPLAARLVQAAEALRAHLERMGTVTGALHASGYRHGQSRGGRPAAGDRDSSVQATREAVTELIEPDRAALRLEPEKLASVFLGMLFSRQPAADGAGPTMADLVDVLLHGALRDPRSAA